MITIFVVSLSRIFELYLNHVLFFRISGNIREPVVGIQFIILSTTSTAAQAAASVFQFEFIIHNLRILYCK